MDLILETSLKSDSPQKLSYRKILVTWLPLVASWTLMSLELPLVNAIIARLPQAEINLAAYGGLVYPIALTIEAPVIMLLAGSTALSRDWQSYVQLRRITLWMGGILAIIHLIVAITPLFDFISTVILGVPAVLVEPGRMALLTMSPWTLAIGYRRFQQGAMIRYGDSKGVGKTTVIRLVVVSIVLTIGYITKILPGVVLAGLAQALGVSAEAIYAGLRVRKILPDIKGAPDHRLKLTLKRFFKFYMPLALTSSLWLLWQPLVSGSVSRMPDPIPSLAIWSVITGLLFMVRSPGVAYNEAVVALLEKSKSFQVLRKFTWIASLVTMGLAGLFVLTPISSLWFTSGANLNPINIPAARLAMVLGIPMAFFTFFISFYQGIIVNNGKTGPVPEAVIIFLITLSLMLIIGVLAEFTKGVYVAAVAYSAAHVTQAFWLMIRSRHERQRLGEN